MERAGNLKNLAERMAEKAEQERIRTEAVFNEQLRSLSDSLRESSQNALRTMSDSMEQEITNTTEKLNRRYRLLSMAFGKRWVAAALLGTSLCFGMALAGWGLVRIGVRKMNRYQTELARVKQDCLEQRALLDDLKSETWDLELKVLREGRFIVFPPGRKPDGRIWNIGDRSAIKMEE